MYGERGIRGPQVCWFSPNPGPSAPPYRTKAPALPALGADALVGPAAVVSAAFMGGFAGVFMELVLMQHGAPIWLRFAQLGLLGALRDTAGIPFCLSRLDDLLPSVRRTALGCLQQITGTHTRTDPDAWRAWCDERNCRETFRANQPSGADSDGASADAPD